MRECSYFLREMKWRITAMGIDFYVDEVNAQSAAAKQMANEYIQFCGMLTDSVNAFMSAPLSSKTYDSAKLYFSVVYPS